MDWQKFAMLYSFLPKMSVNSAGLIPLDILKRACVKVVPSINIHDVCGTRHDMCFSLFTVSSIHSIRKRIRMFLQPETWKQDGR